MKNKPTKRNEPTAKPVESEEFWHDRILRIIARGGMLHEIIYDIDYDSWVRIQNDTAGTIARYVKPGDLILDAGCGYGCLFECLQTAGLSETVVYIGVDVSPDLIRMASYRFADSLLPPRFTVGDLRNLHQFEAKVFDWVLCRSVRGMIESNFGLGAFDSMERELQRIGRNILYMEYPEGNYSETPWDEIPHSVWPIPPDPVVNPASSTSHSS